MKFAEIDQRLLVKQIFAALRAVTAERQDFKTPTVLSTNFLCRVEGDSSRTLCFPRPQSRRFQGAASLGSEFGVEFLYGMRGRWNNGEAFIKLSLYDLRLSDPGLLCQIGYLRYKGPKEIIRSIRFSSEKGFIDPAHPIPSLDRLQRAVFSFVSIILTNVEGSPA